MIRHSFLTPLLLAIELGLVVGSQLVSFSACRGGFAGSCDWAGIGLPGPYFFCWLDRLRLLVQSIINCTVVCEEE
jgi:hypothetical protein